MKHIDSASAVLRNNLKLRFQSLHDEPPKWAWPYPPSIPFIGKRFSIGGGVMIYASAENFSWMNQTEPPERFFCEQVWDRFRAAYEETSRESPDFFPDVGIAPVSNGGLLAAALFVSVKTGHAVADQPRKFIEHIAFTNWAKFSVRSEKNRDYLNDSRKLILSLPYVVEELAMLRPALAMIPKSIWRFSSYQVAMRGASPGTKFIPIPQCNSQVINCHLWKFDPKAAILRDAMARLKISSWMEKLTNLNRRHAWRYLAYLDSVLEGDCQYRGRSSETESGS